MLGCHAERCNKDGKESSNSHELRPNPSLISLSHTQHETRLDVYKGIISIPLHKGKDHTAVLLHEWARQVDFINIQFNVSKTSGVPLIRQTVDLYHWHAGSSLSFHFNRLRSANLHLLDSRKRTLRDRSPMPAIEEMWNISNALKISGCWQENQNQKIWHGNEWISFNPEQNSPSHFRYSYCPSSPEHTNPIRRHSERCYLPCHITLARQSPIFTFAKQQKWFLELNESNPQRVSERSTRWRK